MPHDKLALCFCAQKNWCFWFNSDPRFHGIAQLQVAQSEHPNALSKDCYLDLSSVKAIGESDLQKATSLGPVPEPLLQRIVNELSNSIDMLPDEQRMLALSNLQGLLGT